MSDQTEPPSDGESDDATSARELVGEIGWMVGGAFGLVLAATLLAEVSGFVSRMLYVIVAGVFLYLPYRLIEQRALSFETFGVASERMWRDLGLGGLLVVVTAAPFAGGFYVWETQVVGSTYNFEWSNFQKWHPERRGRPAGWGSEPGVWAWTEDREVHLGLRAGPDGELTVDLRMDRSAAPEVVGPVELAARDGEGRGSAGEGRATRWRASLERPNKRAEIVVRPEAPGTGEYPARVAVSVDGPGESGVLRVGPGAERVEGGEFSFERGLGWILLWLMTQVVLIALPEEVFYRGYLQTRVRQALEAYRAEGEDRERGEVGTRAWLGITEQNVVASVVFGVAHLLIPIGGQLIATRISVAFPSVVFGWLRDRTGSIVASVVYHAGCNMLVLLAAPRLF
jgi:hypothetical protein